MPDKPPQYEVLSQIVEDDVDTSRWFVANDAGQFTESRKARAWIEKHGEADTRYRVVKVVYDLQVKIETIEKRVVE